MQSRVIDRGEALDLTRAPVRLALIGNQAFAMVNFRGPLIASLKARGVEVFALVPGLTAEHEAALRELGARPVSYRLNRTGLNPIEDVASAVQLFGALKAIRPDKVLSFGAKPVIFGTLAAWVARVPHRYALIEGLGRCFVDLPGQRHPVLRLVLLGLYRLSLPRTTRTLYVNRDDMADLVGRRAVPPSNAEVIGGIGVDLDAWRWTPPMRDPVTFLFAARLIREKGVLDFIAAARQVRQQCPTARFVVLGATEAGGTIIDEQLRRSVDEGVVEWHGHVPVRPWLERASAFVLPSYYREGIPRSIQEAMAVGRAVITTDTPGCRDAVVPGESGLLVSPRNPTELADAMLTFVHAPELIDRMGQRGRSLAEERYDVHAANARTLMAIGL